MRRLPAIEEEEKGSEEGNESDHEGVFVAIRAVVFGIVTIINKRTGDGLRCHDSQPPSKRA